MIDYETMWRTTCDELVHVQRQNARLKGNAQENPTLRDQFAMAALTGLLANPNDRAPYDDVVAYAYNIADKMLVVRQ